jgi:hypothetical protein
MNRPRHRIRLELSAAGANHAPRSMSLPMTNATTPPMPALVWGHPTATACPHPPALADRLNLFELHTVAEHLDLMVHPPDVMERSVGGNRPPSFPIAGPVEHL